MQLVCQTKVLSLHHFETKAFYIWCAVSRNLVVIAQFVSPSSSRGWGGLLGDWGLSSRRTGERCTYRTRTWTWASCVLLADVVCDAKWCACGARCGWRGWNVAFFIGWFLGHRISVASFWRVAFALAYCARQLIGFLREALFKAWSAYGMLIFFDRVVLL